MSNKIKILDSGAVLSPDKAHRYSLWRTWDYSKPRIMFIGLNPSRADAIKSDPTITRCINFADGWGYGSLYFANLFSFRTPYVYVQAVMPDIEEQWEPLLPNLEKAVGPDCDGHLMDMMEKSDKVVCCWGSWAFIDERSFFVQCMLLDMPFCLGKNKDGSPKHPLYLKSTTPLEPFVQFENIKRLPRK